MDIDWPVVTRQLLIGAIGLAAGLVIGYAGYRFALRRLVEEHKNQLAILERTLAAQEQQRKDDKEDLERRERVETLTSGINDPETLKRTLEMRELMKLERFEELRSERGIRAGSSRMRLLLFVLLIVLAGLVAATILVLR